MKEGGFWDRHGFKIIALALAILVALFSIQIACGWSCM
jgi:hypothetical protein